MYVHGGGYVHPLTPDYWRLVRALGRVPAEVVVPVYPLAPDATADDVLPRLLELVDDGRDLPTVLMGDSAGGALVLVLARLARDRGIPVAGVVALSPWLDATLQVREDEVQSLEVTDPMLAETGLRAAGRAWSGERSVEDPLISPVHLDLDAARRQRGRRDVRPRGHLDVPRLDDSSDPRGMADPAAARGDRAGTGGLSAAQTSRVCFSRTSTGSTTS